MQVDQSLVVGLGSISIVVALVEGIKATFPALEHRWYFPLSLFMGILWNVFAALLLALDPRNAILVGALTGLSASGFYAGVKANVTARKEQ